MAVRALHALGLDIGLSGVRAAVVREDGVVCGTGRCPHTSAVRAPGIAEHQPWDWLDGIRHAARGALRAADGVAIDVVGVSALGPAPVVVDADLRPLTGAPLFALDRRADARRLELVATAPAAATAAADHAIPHLRRIIEDQPAIRDRLAWVLDATGFVVAQCVGTPVMDAITRGDHVWDGIEPIAPLPDPIDPLAIAGELTAAGAEFLELPRGTPVIAGTYDSFADIAAAGVSAPDDAGLVLGSTVIVGVARDHAEPVDGLGVAPYPGEGILIGGWTLSGGAVLDWAARVFGPHPEEGFGAAAARLDPGDGGLLCLPYLAGERTPVWDPLGRGAVLGLSLHTTPVQLYRALVDALALSVRDHVDRLPGEAPRCWRTTGGGTQNAAWLHACADAIGASLDVVADAGEAVAPALLGLEALGVPRRRRVVCRIEPDPVAAQRFDDLVELYRPLHELLRETHDRLARRRDASEAVC